jgi:cysteine desulfurase
MLALDRRGIAVSTGSACHSGRPQPSPVLLAMGVAESEALASLRISFGLTNTRDEVAALLEALASEVARIRDGVPALP